MSAIGSLSTALTTLRENPVILLGALLLISLGEAYVLIDIYVDSLLAIGIWPVWFLLMPFLLGGFVALIHDGLSGSATFGAFVRGGRDHYVSMLAATVALGIGFFVVSLVVMMVLLVLGIGAAAAGGGALIAVVAGGAILLVLLGLTFMFVQFYDTAIVVSGDGALESFSHSIGLVVDNFRSVLGFSVLFFVISSLGHGPGMALYLTAIEFTETGDTVVASESMLALSIVVTLVFGTVVLAYAYTYFVAFYSSLVEHAEPAASTLE